MSKKRRSGGFTMAELLIVVAIISVLGGVGFIAVNAYQKSMTQMEYDTIAKELFVAAQNHLTMAEGQGFLGLQEDQMGESDGKGAYYIVVDSGIATYPGIFEQMLPMGSIDETVRSGGSYIIRYQMNPAAILDVFYSDPKGGSGGFGKYGCAFSSDDYNVLVPEYLGDKHKSYKDLIGWFGYGADGYGEGVLDIPTATAELATPTIEVVNKERLTVTVTYPDWVIDKPKPLFESPDDANAKYYPVLQLIITGKLNSDGKRAIKTIKLSDKSNPYFVLDTGLVQTDGNGVFTVVLDDITVADKHFADFAKLPTDNGISFKPGENITVQAVAYNAQLFFRNGADAKSNAETTNSLFAGVAKSAASSINGISDESAATSTAMISNMRHLENLDAQISDLDSTLGINAARQTADLVWNEPGNDYAFVQAINKPTGSTGKISVYNKDDTEVASADNYFPVSPDYKLVYDGARHSISKVSVDCSYETGAGLFGAMAEKSSVSNLRLVDFSIKATNPTKGNAGALAGNLENATVNNVIAYHNAETKNAMISAPVSAGGLIGSMNGGSVTNSAAALVVSGGASAGGLIGTATGATVTGCYSGGHTDNGKYSDTVYNVTATGVAGGLIGIVEGTSSEISNSYSTCSAAGATAGGFVGTASGAIKNCYATGLVKGTTEGAFAGGNGASFTSCNFYEIVNEREQKEGETVTGYTYLPPVPVTTENPTGAHSGITAIDKDAGTYNAFVGSDWKGAWPYDPPLRTYYRAKYPLRTVEQLGATVESGSYVATHYGDWPAPEIFVINN